MMSVLDVKRAYKALFLAEDGTLNEHAKIIMDDLRSFCRADSSTAVMSPATKCIDPLASMLAEGRREAFMRIDQMVHLPDRVLTDTDD